MAKGQITVFIIIGILIVLFVGLFIYLYEAEVGIEPIEVPADFKPIYEYTSSCLYSLGKEAVTIAGSQGGYIYFPPKIEKNPSSYLALDPYGLAKIPYWVYHGDDRIPKEEILEQEISRFIMENLNSCLQDYAPFQNQYEISELAPLNVETEMANKDVVITMVHPMRFQGAKTIEYTDPYITVLPVQLKKVYDTGVGMMLAENDQGFLENLTLKLMVGDPKIPFGGMDLDCSPKKWYLDDVKQEISEVIYYNLPRIRVEGTDYPPFEESMGAYSNMEDLRDEIREELSEGNSFGSIDIPKDRPADSYDYFNLFFHPEIPNTNLKAIFLYDPSWGIDINAKPNDNGILSSNRMKGASKFLRFICINQYHFTYDIIYPVKVMIRDDEAFNGEGYVFQYAFNVLIDDNSPARKTFSHDLFTGYEMDAEFCDRLGSKFYDIRAIGDDEFGYEDELRDVNISYLCLGKYCDLGQTYVIDNHYGIYTPLPDCDNPFIMANKEGYIEGVKQLKSDESGVNIHMTKLKKMKFNVLKQSYSSTTMPEESRLMVTDLELGENDEIVFTMSLYNSTYSKMFTINKSGLDYDGQGYYIEIPEVDGLYELDVMLTRFDEIVGGYHSTNTTIDYDDVINNDEIIFSVFEFKPSPRREELQQQMMMYMYGNDYQEKIKPKFR